MSAQSSTPSRFPPCTFPAGTTPTCQAPFSVSTQPEAVPQPECKTCSTLWQGRGHTFLGETQSEHTPSDRDANLDTDALHLRWFNHWLKGTGEFTREPRIRHFALNQNQWHSSQGWGSSRACFYLHSDGRANSSKGNGRLSALCPLDPQPPDIFVYDPEVPVLAPGGLANTPGPANQAALERGNNVLVYTSEPLLKPLHVFGVANVELLAMTSAPSVDIVAKLILLKPGGEAIFLSIGILRAQSQPDEICAWNFHLDATSCLFCEGDAIRLEIASSAYPLFDRNPSNKIPARMASPWNWKRSTQTLFHDKDHSSRLILPVLEASA